MAEVGRSGSWIAVDPAESLPGFRRVHARQLDWDEASATLQAAGWRRPALTAAWLDLEPGRIEDAVKRANAAPAPGPGTIVSNAVEEWHAERADVVRSIKAEILATEELIEVLIEDGAIEEANTLVHKSLSPTSPMLFKKFSRSSSNVRRNRCVIGFSEAI